MLKMEGGGQTDYKSFAKKSKFIDLNADENMLYRSEPGMAPFE